MPKRATIDIISGGRTSGVYHVGVEVAVERMYIRMITSPSTDYNLSNLCCLSKGSRRGRKSVAMIRIDG